MIVSADDERSQLRNRRLALDRLRRRLAEALRVDPPRRPDPPHARAAVERRLEAKRHQAARKRERRRPHDD